MSVCELLKPKPVSFTEVAPNCAHIVLEPLERGFGNTIGVSLSGILLKTLPGCAIDAFQIDGVSDENSVKADMVESVFELIMNLKTIAVASEAPLNSPVWLSLVKSGEGEVKASDIVLASGISFPNPDAHICTLKGAKAALSMKIRVSYGRGYVPASSDAHIPAQSDPDGRLSYKYRMM